MYFRLFVIIGLASVLLSACISKEQIPAEVNERVAVQRMNGNVKGLSELLNASLANSLFSSFTINSAYDGEDVFRITLSEGNDIVLYNALPPLEMHAPLLSLGYDQGSYYWVLNGDYLLDASGRRVEVLQDCKPVFSIENGEWYCCFEDDEPFPIQGDSGNRKFSFHSRYDDASNSLFLELGTGMELGLSGESDNWFFKDNVRNEAYYKDIFMDAGLGLTPRKVLYSASFLGLSLDYLCLPSSEGTEDEINLQNKILAGDENDTNGVLLYPDGQPRYKLLFVNGGNSRVHGASLNESALANMRSFVKNGGSYVGTCAGAFFASNGYDTYYEYPYYLSLWPSIMIHTGLSDVRTGMFIEDNSPLLKYYDFGGDKYVKDIRHNRGGYPRDLPENTEVLARYDYPESDIHMKPSIWAYKPDERTGRVIQEGSHPEEVSGGERLELTAAMLLYAIDGRGIANPKGFLHCGETRVMNKVTTDNRPGFAAIGDMQCHHFVIYVPSEATNISMSVESEKNCKLRLMLNDDTFAFPSNADYVSNGRNSHQSLSFPSLKGGIWFVSVQCTSSVPSREKDYGVEYNDNLGLLNGVPYKVKVSWDITD